MVLIRGFFVWQFSDIGFKASELGICTHTGKWESRRSNIRWMRKTNTLFVTLPLSLILYTHTHAHYCLLVELSVSHFNDSIITAATATDFVIGNVDGWLD
jgi:hypothetical protein